MTENLRGRDLDVARVNQLLDLVRRLAVDGAANADVTQNKAAQQCSTRGQIHHIRTHSTIGRHETPSVPQRHKHDGDNSRRRVTRNARRSPRPDNATNNTDTPTTRTTRPLDAITRPSMCRRQARHATQAAECRPQRSKRYLKHVPRISFTVPVSVLAMDLKRIVRATSITWSSVRLPECLTGGPNDTHTRHTSAAAAAAATRTRPQSVHQSHRALTRQPRPKSRTPSSTLTQTSNRTHAGYSTRAHAPFLGPFLRSRTGSFRALMTRDDADGTTSTW